MGQGQAEIAMKLLSDSSKNGDWLCLKNLHLVTAWLPKLEKVSLEETTLSFTNDSQFAKFYFSKIKKHLCYSSRKEFLL